MPNQKATQEQWLQRVAAWHDSGLCQNAWCRQSGIKPPQFGYWKKVVDRETDGFTIQYSFRFCARFPGAEAGPKL